ncbi:ABC transporter transmembrane domain-containing protein [Oricola cellulosilytica]|uniref:ATP-binding cassette domain-containing protein n=1 Tax=Oricola cellulosilytica TaxID=1429082 RepID=A0A4R0P4E3_9HYPH|nr:ABC transporter transmembrane domain-containing protein [Oricola cellulosilytica]TCD11446.1 ATP-binding cassette domain-containing protein [Oricola cellulosilytica]
MNTTTKDDGAGKKRKNLRPLARMFPYLLRYKGLVSGAAVFLVLAAATTLTLPTAVRRMIDYGFNDDNTALINDYFGMLVVIAAVLALASSMRYYFVITLGERVVSDIRRDVFAHVMTLSSSFYDTAMSGEIVSRLTADTTQIKSAVGATASLALRNTILGLGAMMMMIFTSPSLSAIVIAAIPIIVLPLVWFGRRVRTRSRAAQDMLADATAYASEAIGSVRSFQVFTNEALATSRFARAVERAFDAARTSVKARSALTAFAIFMVFSSVVAVLWIGAQNVLAGTMSPGTLGQFLLYAVFAAGALAALSEVWGELQQAAGAAERLSELLSETPAIQSPADPIAMPIPAEGAVAFDQVSFSYPTRPEESAVTGLDFEIAPGETLAVVGPSGAGKSTLFALLLRQYDPNEGTVRIDGVDLREALLDEARARFAIVPQDVTIFSGTAADNIAFAKPGASREAVIEAAKAAQAHDFISALPDGYDTEVGERGVTLSGGQRQRVAIARAILRDAPILLLDEATSALDAESEKLVQMALERLMEGRTTIVIAHRLATILKSDRILVMQHGRIVEEGTHQSLSGMADGVYSRLAKLQFDAGIEELAGAAE